MKNLFKTTKVSTVAAAALSGTTMKDNQKSLFKKSKGALAANFTMIGLGAFLLVGTIMAGYAISTFTGDTTNNKISMLADEMVEIHNSALTYSLKATTNGYGFEDINSDTLSPWMRANLKMDDTTVGAGDDSYFCSATPYGCKVQYWLSSDSVSKDTYSITVDASAALGSDDDLGKQFEVTATKAMLRVVPTAEIAADQLAGTTTDAAPTSAPLGTPDAIFAIANLN
ncbi:MAG: hypothetical protein U9O87_02340 [Verrucomicrobiota bacterium]|nr:hypothetical protein [Verrucomicrobiota bacterium]